MKPMIFDYSFDEEHESVTMLLSMSSLATLKPALLFGGFMKSKGHELDNSALDLHRVDIYKLCEDGEKSYIEPFITDDTSKRFYLNV